MNNFYISFLCSATTDWKWASDAEGCPKGSTEAAEGGEGMSDSEPVA